MPLDPFQGQEVYSGETPQPPLPMRMMGNLPGIATGIAFNAKRGANTIMSGGGFLDDATLFANRRATRYGAFRKGMRGIESADVMSGKSLLQYGPTKRSMMNSAGKMRDPWFRGARINNATARPRAFRRMHSLSVFSEGESGLYSHAGGVRGLGKARFGPLGKMADNLGVGADEALLGPGLFSAISAGRRIDKIEKRVLAGGRGSRQLAKVDRSIMRLASMNNPGMISSVGPGGMIGPVEPYVKGLSGAVSGEGLGAIGVRGNLLASAMPGKGTQFMAGYVRGAAGFGPAKMAAGLDAASVQEKYIAQGLASKATQLGAKTAIRDTAAALGEGITTKSGTLLKGMEGARTLLNIEGKGIVRELGIKGAMQFASSGQGAKVLATRGLYASSKALPVIGQAMLVYDLAKMGGEIIKSGINLARDAEKSLQGSFSKSTFGMGYRDSEAAATSRSRGVMAIQNSRLNARSALGTEAGMMSAHFG